MTEYLPNPENRFPKCVRMELELVPVSPSGLIVRLLQKVKYKDFQVKATGTLTEPIWIFEVKTGKEILQGLLQNTPLATIDVTAKPCKLVPIFNVTRPEHICITDGAYLGTSNISKKKTAVIERGIIRRLLEGRLKEKPYLSRVELTYG